MTYQCIKVLSANDFTQPVDQVKADEKFDNQQTRYQ